MQATTMTGLTEVEVSNNTETSKQLTKILNTFYTSGIDRIKTYGKTPSGNIIGEFIADGTSFQYLLNLKANTVSYEPVGNKSVSKADSLLAEQENADRFKEIYSTREAFEVSEASAIEQKLDSWFFRADATAKAKVGVKTAANKSGKTLTCTPGKTFPCGAVCRAMGKPCKQPMSSEVQEIAKQVAAKIKTPTATATPTTTPATTTAPASAPSGKITAQKMAEQIAVAKALEPDAPKDKGETNKLFPTLVNSKRIPSPTQEFDKDELMAAAEAMLKIGGFVKPPVLRRKGEGFEIVSGEFQVAAAIVAKAIKPLGAENFPAFIIDDDNEEAIMSQVNLIKKQRSNPQTMASEKTIKSKSIESYNDFKKTAIEIYDRLNKEKRLQGLVPIHTMRKEFGEKLGKKQFDEWLLDMQDKDIIQLTSGDTQAMTPKEREESLTMPGGSSRHLIKKL